MSVSSLRGGAPLQSPLAVRAGGGRCKGPCWVDASVRTSGHVARKRGRPDLRPRIESYRSRRGQSALGRVQRPCPSVRGFERHGLRVIFDEFLGPNMLPQTMVSRTSAGRFRTLWSGHDDASLFFSFAHPALRRRACTPTTHNFVFKA